MLQSIKIFYRYISDEYEIENVVKDIRYLKEKKLLLKTFTEEEVADLIRFYNKAGYVNQRNKLIIEIMADAGLRVSEVRNLKNSDIIEGYLQFLGKGNKERVARVSPYLEKSILKYKCDKTGCFNDLRIYREVEDFLFFSKSGRQLKNNVLLEKIVKDARIATNVRDEIQRKSCHTLRHFYTQKLLRNGTNLYAVSRLLGHSSIKTTQTY